MGLFGFNMADDDFANLQETSDEREAKMRWQSENPGSSLGETAMTPNNIKMPVSNFQNRYGNNADNRDNFAPTYTDSLSMFPERGQDPSGFKKWLGDAPNKYDNYNLGLDTSATPDRSNLGLDSHPGYLPHVESQKSVLARYKDLNRLSEANREIEKQKLRSRNIISNLGEAATQFATARGAALGTYRPDNYFDQLRNQNLQYYKNAIAGDDKKQSNAFSEIDYDNASIINDRAHKAIDPNSPVSRVQRMGLIELAKRSGVKVTPEQEAALSNISAQDIKESDQIVRGGMSMALNRQKEMFDPKSVGDYYDEVNSPYADAVRTLAVDAFKKRKLPVPSGMNQMTPRQIDDWTSRYLGKQTSSRIMEMADGVYNVGSDGIATPVFKEDGSKLRPTSRASVQPKIVNDGEGKPYVVSGSKLVPMEIPPEFTPKQSAANAKAADYAGASKIPGYKLDEGYKPTQKNIDIVRKAVIMKESILSDLDLLDALYAKAGGPQLYGDLASQMDTILNRLIIKQKELDNLGALTGPDLGLVQAELPDPTSYKAKAKDWMGQDTYNVVSSEYRNGVDTNAKIISRFNGYIPEESTEDKKQETNKPKKNSNTPFDWEN